MSSLIFNERKIKTVFPNFRHIDFTWNEHARKYESLHSEAIFINKVRGTPHDIDQVLKARQLLLINEQLLQPNLNMNQYHRIQSITQTYIGLCPNHNPQKQTKTSKPWKLFRFVKLNGFCIHHRNFSKGKWDRMLRRKCRYLISSYIDPRI